MDDNLVNKLPEDFRRQLGQFCVFLYDGKKALHVNTFLFFLLKLILNGIRLGL